MQVDEMKAIATILISLVILPSLEMQDQTRTDLNQTNAKNGSIVSTLQLEQMHTVLPEMASTLRIRSAVRDHAPQLHLDTMTTHADVLPHSIVPP